MGTIRKGGFRVSDNVFKQVMQEARQANVTERQLLKAAKELGQPDNYLSGNDLRVALAALVGTAGYEKMLEMPTDAFAASARADLTRPPGSRIPQIAALEFDRAGAAQGAGSTQGAGPVEGPKPSLLAARRDEIMDQVAHAVADRFNDMRYWRAEVIGGDKGTADMKGGALPQEYPYSGGREYGEAYNLIKVHVPSVGDETFALIWKRIFNEWTSDGEQHNYIDDQAELQLAFVDPEKLTLYGSGYTLDGSDNDDFFNPMAADPFSAKELFGETNPAKLREKIDQLADEIVANLEHFKELND